MMNWLPFGNFRNILANIAGRTFHGKRDLYKALGYNRELFPWDYRARYERNAVANRVVKALPQSTWRGGAEVIEDEDPTVETAFETAWEDLQSRLKLWTMMSRADILGGIGRYSVLLIGAPGEMDTPLLSATADQIAYVQPYAEEDATIREFDIDTKSERFGLPIFYVVKRAAFTNGDALNSYVVGKPVHYSRVIHIADGLLDDRIFGEPRLKCVWNLLDDLEKVTGGGAEAFWKRADGGMQFDIDPELNVEPDQLQNFKKEVDEYEHRLRRNMLTRGMTINRLGSDVADFSSPVTSIISQISAGTGIPQRVLMGSEQGKLAANADRSNWDQRVADRRDDYAAPHIVRPVVDRLIELGALPKPVDNYDVRWNQLRVLDDKERATVAGEWSALNKPGMPVVVTSNEIRERVLDLPPIEEVTDQTQEPAAPPAVKAAAKGGAPVHVVADRFRTRFPTRRERLLRRRQVRAEQEWVDQSDRVERQNGDQEPHRYGADGIRAALEG